MYLIVKRRKKHIWFNFSGSLLLEADQAHPFLPGLPNSVLLPATVEAVCARQHCPARVPGCHWLLWSGSGPVVSRWISAVSLSSGCRAQELHFLQHLQSLPTRQGSAMAGCGLSEDLRLPLPVPKSPTIMGKCGKWCQWSLSADRAVCGEGTGTGCRQVWRGCLPVLRVCLWSLSDGSSDFQVTVLTLKDWSESQGSRQRPS